MMTMGTEDRNSSRSFVITPCACYERPIPTTWRCVAKWPRSRIRSRSQYPREPFATLEDASAWMAGFVRWYNEEHSHCVDRAIVITKIAASWVWCHEMGDTSVPGMGNTSRRSRRGWSSCRVWCACRAPFTRLRRLHAIRATKYSLGIEGDPGCLFGAVALSG